MRDLVVRRCEPEDYRAVHVVYSSPQAMAETLGVPYSSEQAWREELARERDDNFAVVACLQGEVVGHLALSVYMNPRTRHSGHFGIAVRDDWQGRGVGTALMEVCLHLADNWLSLTRLDLRVYTDNAPAIALYKKFGFEIEGTHRRFAYRNGEYVDAHVMARLRADCDPPAPGMIYERETSERSGAVTQCEVCGNDYDKAFCVLPTNISSVFPSPAASPITHLRSGRVLGSA